MNSFFDRTTLILLVLTAGVLLIAHQKTGVFPWASTSRAGKLLLTNLPNICLGMLHGGVIMDLLPKEFIEGWLSDSSGWRGIAVAWAAGAVMPMGAPWVVYPIALGLMQGGAGVGPVVALLTSTLLLNPFRYLAFELPILGGGFFAARLLAVFWVPPVTGFLAQAAARLIRV